jgi:hypothetical protein
MMEERQRALENGRTVAATFTTAVWLAELRIDVLRQPVAQVRREIDARLAQHQLAGLTRTTNPVGRSAAAGDAGSPGHGQAAARAMDERDAAHGHVEWSECQAHCDGLTASAEGRHDESIRF